MVELTNSLKDRYFAAYRYSAFLFLNCFLRPLPKVEFTITLSFSLCRLWKDWISVLFLSSLEATLIDGGKTMCLLSMTVSKMYCTLAYLICAGFIYSNTMLEERL